MMRSNLSQQLSRDVPSSLEGRFMVKPEFLRVIRKVNGVDPKKMIFTYKEVSIFYNFFKILTSIIQRLTNKLIRRKFEQISK